MRLGLDLCTGLVCAAWSALFVWQIQSIVKDSDLLLFGLHPPTYVCFALHASVSTVDADLACCCVFVLHTEGTRVLHLSHPCLLHLSHTCFVRLALCFDIRSLLFPAHIIPLGLDVRQPHSSEEALCRSMQRDCVLMSSTLPLD